MLAYVLEAGKLQLKEMPRPKLGAHDVRVSLKVAGLNRRDLYIKGRVGHSPHPLILGSDGAGIITEVGHEVDRVDVGDQVIINPSLRWYKKSEAPPEQFDILGMPNDGTFAEEIVICAEQVEKKPYYLSWHEAGVLSLAALTGYRALFTKGCLEKDETVFIPGASSGVATFMIQFAKAYGARVIVSSRDEAKRQSALKIGADRAIDTNSDWVELLKDETIDLVIDSVGQATFNRALHVLKKGGKIVTFGATTEDTIQLNLREFFYGQYKLLGSTMGSREELHELLTFMEKHHIKPVVGHTFHLNAIDEAFYMLEVNKQFGKIAIEMNVGEG